MAHRFDFVIAGAGIMGLAIAREMASYCEENRLPLRRSSKIILPVQQEQDSQIEVLLDRALDMGSKTLCHPNCNLQRLLQRKCGMRYARSQSLSLQQLCYQVGDILICANIMNR